MKELSNEEKAKAYDKAVEIAKSKMKNDKDHVLYEDDIKEIFPELKESEDERIRKALIHLINEQDGFLTSINGISVKDVITWLEKQGERKLANSTQTCKDEHKPIEKVKPKFKVGDYVKNVNDKREPIYEIVYMDKECYVCEYRGKENIGDKSVMHFAFDNPHLRLVEQKPVDKVEPKFHEGDWITIKE